MKRILTLLLCGLSGVAMAQKQDTVFLKARTSEGHSIYIDPNRNSKAYQLIANTSYAAPDREYKMSLKELSKHRTKSFKKSNTLDIPLKWYALKWYKGRYYVYAPSDWSSVRILISDSTFIFQQMERAISLIHQIEKTGTDRYSILRTQEYASRRSKVNIYMVDRKRGIAVFENLYDDPQNKGSSYELMVDLNKIKNYPVIVNYSPHHKDLEFAFDEPDFKALLKQGK